jgi:hypothetical protein
MSPRTPLDETNRRAAAEFAVTYRRYLDTLRGYCHRIVAIADGLTSLQALRRAEEAGEMDRLRRLMDEQRRLEDRSDAMYLSEQMLRLAPAVDGEGLAPLLAETYERHRVTREAWADGDRALLAAGGVRTDADAQAVRERALACFAAALDMYDVRERVILEAVRLLDQDTCPEHPTARYCLLAGYRVRWDGETDLQPQLWRILEYLLSRDDYPFAVGHLEEAIWRGEGVTMKTMQNKVSALGAALLPIQFPWSYRINKSHVYRDGD